MTSPGQITVTDLNVWQARALRALTTLQCAALKAERPPLQWTVTPNGALRGTVDRHEPGLTDTDRRAVFDEWVDTLNGTPPRPSRQMTGSTILTSVFTVPTDRGDVRGTLVVEFD